MTKLSHVDESGSARMVDVAPKPDSSRAALATGAITMAPETFEAILENRIAKGDVLSVARIAGIMAAKRTAELIPLCHPIALTNVAVDLELDPLLPGVRVAASASTVGKTGVEMEALTAVATALLTIYDMAKAMDRGMIIGEIALAEKAEDSQEAGASPARLILDLLCGCENSLSVPRDRLVSATRRDDESRVLGVSRHRTVHHQVATSGDHRPLEFVDRAQQIGQLRGILIRTYLDSFLTKAPAQLHRDRFRSSLRCGSSISFLDSAPSGGIAISSPGWNSAAR